MKVNQILICAALFGFGSTSTALAGSILNCRGGGGAIGLEISDFDCKRASPTSAPSPTYFVQAEGGISFGGSEGLFQLRCTNDNPTGVYRGVCLNATCGVGFAGGVYFDGMKKTCVMYGITAGAQISLPMFTEMTIALGRHGGRYSGPYTP